MAIRILVLMEPMAIQTYIYPPNYSQQVKSNLRQVTLICP